MTWRLSLLEAVLGPARSVALLSHDMTFLYIASLRAKQSRSGPPEVGCGARGRAGEGKRISSSATVQCDSAEREKTAEPEQLLRVAEGLAK